MIFKKFRFLISAVTLVVVLGLVTYLFSRHASAVSQSGQKPDSPAPASADATQVQQLPPGTIIYKPKANTLAVTIARKYLVQSPYMTVPEYEAAMRSANDGKTSFKKDQEVLVPAIEPQPIVEKSRPFPKDGEIRAVYLTGSTAGSAKGIEIIRRWKQAGGNSVVFDIKDSDGSVNIPFENPLAPVQKNHPI